MKGLKRALQKGFSTMQVVAGLAIAAVVTAGAAAVMVPAYNTMILNSAFEEIGVIASATRSVREYEGGYSTASNLTYLVTNGYLPNPPYSDGVNENRLGNTITVVGAATNVAVTYMLDDQPQCQNILARLDSVVGITGTSTCSSAGLLSFTMN